MEFIPPSTHERTRLELPLPPNVANPGRHFGHWRTRHRAKVAWMDGAALAVSLNFPATCYPRARVTCHFFVWSRMDADNLAARQKWVLDFLKSPTASVMGNCVTFGGWIADDDPLHLELLPPYQTVDRKHRRVEVTIESLADISGG